MLFSEEGGKHIPIIPVGRMSTFRMLFSSREMRWKLSMWRSSYVQCVISTGHTRILPCYYIHNSLSSYRGVRITQVSIATGYGLDGPGSINGIANFFSSLQRPDSSSPYTMGDGGDFPGSKAAGAWIWPHTSISSADVKNGGAMPPLPQMYSWCGTLLTMHRGNFTFLPYRRS
jgi:hypothetical protein